MVNDYDRSFWKNQPEREVKLMTRLEDGSKTFSHLLRELKWGPQTLNVYLKNLEKKGVVERRKRGKNVFYTLIRSSPYARQMMGWKWTSDPDVRIIKRIELEELDEEQFITDWLNTMKFSFLNIIKSYVLLGEKTRESNDTKKNNLNIEHFIRAHISDLEDIVTLYGEKMAEEINVGSLKPKRIMEIHNKLQKQIKQQHFSRRNRARSEKRERG